MRLLQPADLLHFVELRAFTEAWDAVLGLNDDDLTALQVLIMFGPKDAPVVAGTGGLRKLRYAPSGWSHGKRGGVRVCYVHYEALGVVLLVTAYAKGRKEDDCQADSGSRGLFARTVIVGMSHEENEAIAGTGNHRQPERV
jgi:hypothetical protein